jgi:hypothetical protein
LGLDDLYRNTKVMDIFFGSPVANTSQKKGATIDTATVGINENILAVLIRGNTWQGGQVGGQPTTAGTITLIFQQNVGTNASSWIKVHGSTMVLGSKNTILATPINATQRYIRGSYNSNHAGSGTYNNFSAVIVGTGRVLPLSTK